MNFSTCALADSKIHKGISFRICVYTADSSKAKQLQLIRAKNQEKYEMYLM